jgi:uncharacterized protein involved in exopolysaccharide biosynthesis
LNGFAEASDQDGNGTGLDLPLLLVRAVVRSFPWMLLLLLLGAAAGFGVGLLQRNRYVSNAKLSLRMGAREQLNSESLVDFNEPQRGPPQAVLDDMADEMQMLSDVAIFERVAQELGPRVVLQPADPGRDDGPLTPTPVRILHSVQGYRYRRMAAFASTPDEDELREATKVLKENTTVSNEPRSRVILLSCTSTSPEMARAIVQALASAFIERHRDQFSIQSLLEGSRSQFEEARLARDKAAKAYVEQVSKSDIAVLEAQIPRLETELSSFESELYAARARHEEISRLRTSLSNRLLGSAAEIDPRLKQTSSAVVQSPELREDLGHSAIRTRIADLETEDKALLARLALVESRLETNKARLSELQNQLLTATMTRKDLASARDIEESRYTHLLDRFSVLEALVNIDTNEAANLRVLQTPTLELEKIGPRRTTLLLRGLVLGMLAAIAFGILRQQFERRLCYPEIFERARGVPVLGVVPHLSSLRRLERHALVGGR